MGNVRLKFDSNQQFQLDAIEAITGIFDGQALRQSLFTAGKQRGGMFGEMKELGYGNKLDLSEEMLLKNVVAIQDRFKLRRSTSLTDEQYGVPNFAVEMETGTGKTYVYTRTMLELRAKYGFAKFIIVVPGVAIREGVKTSLDLTKEHFRELYPDEPFDYFVYDSDRLEAVRDFATSETMQVMIINIDAFRKSFSEKGSANALRIYQQIDGMEGRRPLDFIHQTDSSGSF
jgi:type III restriction enzyme